MEDKKLLFVLNDLEVDERIKIYSSDSDILGNEKVDIYILHNQGEEIIVSYDKKGSLECEDMDINFKNTVKKIGTKKEESDVAICSLTENEKKIMDVNNDNFEEGKIYKHFPLEGEYVDGTTFSFNNIINVEIL